MPDPFGTSAAAIALVGQTISGLQKINDYISRYRSADLEIASMSTECCTIHRALIQLNLQNNILQHGNAGDDYSTYNVEDFEGVLGACVFTFGALKEQLSKLDVQDLNRYNESTVMSKIRAVWNMDEMNKIRNNIRGLAVALNLLLTVSQVGTQKEIFNLLTQRQNREILETVSEDARTLGASRRARTTDGDDEAPSTIGEEEFEFDDEIINSRTYRRAFAAAQRQARQTDEERRRQGPRVTLKSATPLGKTFRESASYNIGGPGNTASKSQPGKKAPSYFHSLLKVRSEKGSGKLNVPSKAEDQPGINEYTIYTDVDSATAAISRPSGEVEADRNSDLNYEHSQVSMGDMMAGDMGQGHNLERQIAYQRDRWRYLHNMASRPIEPKERLEDFEELERSEFSLLRIEDIIC